MIEAKGDNTLPPLVALIKTYYEKGFCILPALKRQKRPALNWKDFIYHRPSLKETLQLFEGKIDPNLCIVCGQVSGVAVLDIDDPEKLQVWLKSKGKRLKKLLSLSSTIRTGKGYHVWFKHPSEDIGVRRFPQHGFELRGTGGIVIVPPSLHPSGNIYWPLHLEDHFFDNLLSWLGNLNLPEVPDWLLEVIKEDEKRAIQYETGTPTLEGADISLETAQKLKSLLKEHLLPLWGEGYRHELACGVGGWLARIGVPQEITETAITEIVNESKDPEFHDRLRAVKDMYANLESGGKVKGVSTVWAILGEQAARKLIKEVYTLLEVEEEPFPEEKLEEELITSTLKSHSFPFERLPRYFREIAQEYSEAFNVEPEYTTSTILSIFSAMVGNALWVAPKADWRVSPFLWLAIVQESGGGKSPLLRELMRPLKELQKKYWNIYEEELKEWKRLPDEEKRGKEAPKLKHVYAEDFTTEALAEIFAQDSRGILVRRDELAGLIGGLGQYKKRTGDDRQRLIELWDCEPWKVDRKGKPLFIKRTGASIIGGIQPYILSKVFDRESFDSGLAPRFLWLVLPTHPRFWTEKEISEQVRVRYNKLLKWAREIPDEGEIRTLILKQSAKELFKTFNNHIEHLFMVLPYPLKTFLPKLKNYALKFALLHHLLKEAERFSFVYEEELGHRIASLVEPDSVEFGIELAYFFASQTKRFLDAFVHKHSSFGLEDVVAEVVLEFHKEIGTELIAIKEITARVNEKLNMNLSPRLISTTLEKMGFTKEAGLKRRIPGKGNSAILLTPDMISKLSSQRSHSSQSIQPQYSEGVKKDVKENPSSHHASPDECEEEKKSSQKPSHPQMVLPQGFMRVGVKNVRNVKMKIIEKGKLISSPR